VRALDDAFANVVWPVTVSVVKNAFRAESIVEKRLVEVLLVLEKLVVVLLVIVALVEPKLVDVVLTRDVLPDTVRAVAEALVSVV
jgi:hypothetical protein